MVATVQGCLACLSRGFRVAKTSVAKRRSANAAAAAAAAGSPAADLRAGADGAGIPGQKRPRQADAAQLPSCKRHSAAEQEQQRQQQQQQQQQSEQRAESRIICKSCEGRGIVHDEGAHFEPVRKPRVVVIGGGIGGCALALALQHRGIPCKVFERDAEFAARAQGYALTMQQAASTLRKLGFTDLKQFGGTPVAHTSLRPDGTVLSEYGRAIHSTTREKLASEGPAAFEQRRFNIQLPREALRKLLFDELSPGTIRWGARFDRYEALAPGEGTDAGFGNPLRVHLTSRDGASISEEADLLVGCDGIWSGVRAQKAGPEPPRYLGVIVVLGRAPCEHPLAVDRMFQTLDGHTRIYTMPFAPGETMWQLSFPLDLDAARALSASGPQAMLAEGLRRCGDWHAPIPELLARSLPENVTGYPAYDRPPLSVDASLLERIAWRDPDPRVVLMGDAAHPMSPFKGQGANQALMDAWSLASLLASARRPANAEAAVAREGCAEAAAAGGAARGEADVAEVTAQFEREMAERVRAKVEKSAEAARVLHSPEGQELRASRLVT